MALKHLHQTARVIVGNTEVGIETKFKKLFYPLMLSPRAVPEMKTLEVLYHRRLSHFPWCSACVSCELAFLFGHCALHYHHAFAPFLTPPHTRSQVSSDKASLVVGGAVTLTRLEHLCAELAAKGGPSAKVPHAIKHMLRWFASGQIRCAGHLRGFRNVLFARFFFCHFYSLAVAATTFGLPRPSPPPLPHLYRHLRRKFS